ncbi:endo alpha-1,4 polygalactosaminidase [Streptomyces sp. MST-110588]|uniref:endo alpha-1,4 polygalactosaminidase n=1 Tax=Streptomyces sp. MST-110588 TaxID=2833628 RepID=UPI001F5D26D6|nr:endo alpha-1,4 polygalactosaminidase [Streptomyces sp. MST-110588]UNO42499.1 endo alpha-1,4 polygalactosaminidase [Streptomyces sp. MST-110588]
MNSSPPPSGPPACPVPSPARAPRPARRRRSLPVLAAALLALIAACAQAPSEAAPKPKPDPRPATGASAGMWRPKPGVAWQWQLTGQLDFSVKAPVYDIDGFNRKASTVADLHRRGRKVICYISVGAWEDFRPDARRFPKSVIGRDNGWEGERWLDIRRLDVLRPLIAKRFDMCRAKGFDAVEPDNVDGYLNKTGFKLTAAHQLAFNRMVAKLAHERGMSVGLKNDMDQIPQLLKDFDFAVNEQCAQYEECETLKPFIKAGKPVFHVEYELPAARFCAQTRKLGFSSMQKRLHLDAWRRAC